MPDAILKTVDLTKKTELKLRKSNIIAGKKARTRLISRAAEAG